MHYERLERLAQLLDQVEAAPEDHMRFDIGTWYRCGTVGCAVGHAMADPWFQEQGLEKEPLSFSSNTTCFKPKFGDATGRLACSWFFEISEDEAWELFTAFPYVEDQTLVDVTEEREVRPHHVATKIREFLAERDSTDRP